METPNQDNPEPVPLIEISRALVCVPPARANVISFSLSLLSASILLISFGLHALLVSLLD
jgi:hypothetical protein